MGQSVTKSDYHWSTADEPHASRRKQILEKYPEVKKLMGHDPQLKYIVTAMVVVQLLSAAIVRDASWPLILVAAYCWGGVINHSMTLAIHEMSHNVAFGHTRPFANRVLEIFGNVILGVPYAAAFRKYHAEHHRYQGYDGVDVDIPSSLETKLFRRTGTKFIWLLLQPLFYVLRPVITRPKPVTGLELTNILVQVAFDVAVYHWLAARSLIYLVSGTLLAMGVHPMAGHFIAEHYATVASRSQDDDPQETFSYYGPLNWITFNVGYHNEHHDFPSIPGCNLPKVRKLAPEFYDTLSYHTSWSWVLWDFVTNRDVALSSRVKRRMVPVKTTESD